MLKYFFVVLVLGTITTHAQVDRPRTATFSTIQVDDKDSESDIISKAAHVVPTANQYAALQNEFIAFIHFGPNTFTRMEWGNGMEDPAVFNLKELHTDQWCESMKKAGMKMVVITVKHHDGFVLWQSRYTTHGIMSTPFKNGNGDILKELSASCKKYGLKLGVYLSPADLFQIESPAGFYGNLSKPRERVIPAPVPGRPFADKHRFKFEVDDYNEYFLNQLFELLTEYGPIHEVWFDGAQPKTKGNQRYNYGAWRTLIRTLAPKAVIFGKEDIRWCGNEAGRTRNTEWNVIPYAEDPRRMNDYKDLTASSLGSREDLYKAKFLTYQQAETNTSIREGWFYRDDNRQKVRTADDVFDIYERAAGGNSTFLLNIPPNRDGKFSPEDVRVLEETGNRIRKTYGTNLFSAATGTSEVLDNKPATFILLNKPDPEIIITTPQPVTINRLVIQEAVASQGERVEKHLLEAWIGNDWKEIINATNIGYKRILRFPEVTASKFRVRILASRGAPAISNITAHWYKTTPPPLQVSRNRAGLVIIEPSKGAFTWNPNGENASKNINSGTEIFYTTDGSNPGNLSTKYTEPFATGAGMIKAVAVNNSEIGTVVSKELGIVSTGWKMVGVDGEAGRHRAAMAFDLNPRTYWQSDSSSGNHFISIDLGATVTLKGFAYTPQTDNEKGMMEKGIIKTSADGISWQEVNSFEFGNLINDPTTRSVFFTKPVTTRFVRIESTRIAAGGAWLSIAELEFFE